MQVDPENQWKIILLFAEPILFILYLCTMLVALPVMSFSYRPLIVLLVFFFVLAAAHLYLIPLIYKTRLKFLGVILVYTVIIDCVLIWFTQKFSISLLLPPVFAAFLLSSSDFFKYLINHHIKRNTLSIFPSNGFIEEVNDFSVEFSFSYMYNIVIYVALTIAGVWGYIFNLKASLLIIRFSEFCFILIMLFSIYKIIIDAMKLISIFEFDFFPSCICLPNGNKNDYSKIRRAVEERMSREELETKEQIIDYFDRAGEIRKLRYYSSVSMLVIACAYMSVYTLLPNRLLSMSVQWVVLSSSLVGLFAIQLPYFIGQKKLAMNLIAGYSGAEYREMMKTLGKESPAWRFMQTGEVLGAGIIPGLFVWGIQHFSGF